MGEMRQKVIVVYSYRRLMKFKLQFLSSQEYNKKKQLVCIIVNNS